MGAQFGYLRVGLEPLIFHTSVSNLISDTSESIVVDHTFSHTLLNFIFAFPIGISYPLTGNLELFVEVRPMIGVSNLRAYDSIHVNIGGLIIWASQSASMSKTSTGMGVLFGGDLRLADRIGLNFGLGYDALSFAGYKGSVTTRVSNGNEEKDDAYWVFDPKRNLIGVKNQPPSNGEIDAVEDLNGLRVNIGLKILLGG